MALAECRECGNEISTKAKTCPQCGAPHPTLPKHSGLVGLALVALVGFGIYSYLPSPTPETRAAAATPLVAATPADPTYISMPAPGDYPNDLIGGKPGPFSHSIKPGTKIQFLGVMGFFHGDAKRKIPPGGVMPADQNPSVRFDFDVLPDVPKLLAACPNTCMGIWQATFKAVEGDILNVFTLDGYKDVTASR
jgi:hypothetical protein